jgi:hypothetical protein
MPQYELKDVATILLVLPGRGFVVETLTRRLCLRGWVKVELNRNLNPDSIERVLSATDDFKCLS